ncbi:hypothetical protein [Sporolactobacillus nakayamae]|uniref:Uncharacterized protein n=1 Tax=Sporolactobacillus nakayamae TaxID=269670 RepID=A0A1I2P3L0_9BACL|nr:hypothetical protein [Sporolactobacillus nakayamae]SFG10040.1 hypothetical protein SAMN02982927_00671 [Sporolactobacillus nakayamae]
MLSKQDRTLMIDFLILAEGCTREFWEKQPDKLLQKNYEECCLSEGGE